MLECRVRLGALRPVGLPALLLALLLGSAGSCAGNSGVAGPPACTEEARASVMVSVVDAGVTPILGAAVTWRANGGESQSAECVDFDLPPSACTRFVAGWEVSGTIDIRAEKGGFRPAAATVQVPMDEVGCHVVTQRVSLVMLPFGVVGR